MVENKMRKELLIAAFNGILASDNNTDLTSICKDALRATLHLEKIFAEYEKSERIIKSLTEFSAQRIYLRDGDYCKLICVGDSKELEKFVGELGRIEQDNEDIYSINLGERGTFELNEKSEVQISGVNGPYFELEKPIEVGIYKTRDGIEVDIKNVNTFAEGSFVIDEGDYPRFDGIWDKLTGELLSIKTEAGFDLNLNLIYYYNFNIGWI